MKVAIQLCGLTSFVYFCPIKMMVAQINMEKLNKLLLEINSRTEYSLFLSAFIKL